MQSTIKISQLLQNSHLRVGMFKLGAKLSLHIIFITSPKPVLIQKCAASIISPCHWHEKPFFKKKKYTFLKCLFLARYLCIYYLIWSQNNLRDNVTVTGTCLPKFGLSLSLMVWSFAEKQLPTKALPRSLSQVGQGWLKAFPSDRCLQ